MPLDDADPLAKRFSAVDLGKDASPHGGKPEKD